MSTDRLIFSTGSTGDGNLWSVSSAGGRSQPFVNLTQHGSQPSASSEGRLVYTVGFRDVGIWQCSIGKEAKIFAGARRVIASSGLDHSAQYSSDGKRIVFVSDRSGTPEIWTANSDGSDARQLTAANGSPIGSPHWSPAEDRIVYDIVKDGYSAIYVMNADGGKRQVVVSGQENYMMPTWSRDGRAIYYTVQMRSGMKLAIWRKWWPQGRAEMLTYGRGDVFELSDGKTIYFNRRGDQQGIWQMPSAVGARASAIAALRNVHTSRYCAVTGSGMFYLAKSSPPWLIQFYNFSNRQISTAAPIHQTPEFGTPSLSVSPDEHTIMYSQLDQSGSDLMLWEEKR